MPRDLFGEVPVTTLDIEAWLRAVPRIDPSSRHAADYVKSWGVVEKIKAAKLAGTFEAITAPCPRAGAWWERFSWAR